MSEQATQGEVQDVLVLPGPISLTKSVVPPVEIVLPLEVFRRAGLRHILLFAIAVAGSAILSVGFLQDAVNQTFSFALLYYLMSILCLYVFGIMAFEIAVVVRNMQKLGPVLIIDGEGLNDLRSNLDIAWRDVETAQVVTARYDDLGVLLRVREEFSQAKPNQHAWIWFPWLRLWTWRRQHLCRTQMLSQPSHVLTGSILTLVKSAGGELVGLSRYQTLLPQPKLRRRH